MFGGHLRVILQLSDSRFSLHGLAGSMKHSSSQSALKRALFTMTRRGAYFQLQMAYVNPNSAVLEAAAKKTVIFQQNATLLNACGVQSQHCFGY